jgi:hypothetical protein
VSQPIQNDIKDLVRNQTINQDARAKKIKNKQLMARKRTSVEGNPGFKDASILKGLMITDLRLGLEDVAGKGSGRSLQ